MSSNDDSNQLTEGDAEKVPIPTGGSNGFIRPGIDDRPDYENALSEEEKVSVQRLAEPIPGAQPATPESLQNPDVQSIHASTASAAPAVAIASVQEGEPLNLESALNDMRDPMADASGHVPSRGELIRLGIGFTLSAVACAIPWVALNSIILPRVLNQISPGDYASLLGTVNSSAPSSPCWPTSFSGPSPT